MKLIASAMIFLLAAGCLSSCIGVRTGGADYNKTVSSSGIADTFTLIRDTVPRQGVSISFPHWDRWDFRTDNFIFGVEGTLLEGEEMKSNLSVCLYFDRRAGSTSPKNYYMQKRIELETDTLEDLGMEIREVSNFADAVCWTYSETESGEKQTHRRYFLGGYQVHFWVSAAIYPTVEDEIEMIAETIRVITPPR
jgi:hypothetical protein